MRDIWKILKGFSMGLTWTYDGTGYSSKTNAVLAGYHHPDSITWRWALYWRKNDWSHVSWRLHRHSYGSFTLNLSVLGAFTFAWQPHMFRGKE